MRVFEIEDETLTDMKRLGMYSRNPRERRPLHKLLSETPICFQRKGVTWESALERVEYNEGNETLCQHPDWAFVMSSITRVPRKEVLYRDYGAPGTGRRAVWRPERKNMSCMKDAGRTSSTRADMVRELCAPTCSTAESCMMLDHNRKFVRRNVDS